MTEIVKLATGHTLPCGIIVGESTCGKPAGVLLCNRADTLPGYQQQGLTGGEWVCLPVCREHAAAMHKVYHHEETD
jgi:hypothetical protein